MNIQCSTFKKNSGNEMWCSYGICKRKDKEVCRLKDAQKITMQKNVLDNRYSSFHS